MTAFPEGSTVKVLRGEHKNRVGLIVKSYVYNNGNQPDYDVYISGVTGYPGPTDELMVHDTLYFDHDQLEAV